MLAYMFPVAGLILEMTGVFFNGYIHNFMSEWQIMGMGSPPLFPDNFFFNYQEILYNFEEKLPSQEPQI